MNVDSDRRMQLKICPFCKKEDIGFLLNANEGEASAYCKNCEARGPETYIPFDDVENATPEGLPFIVFEEKEE